MPKFKLTVMTWS